MTNRAGNAAGSLHGGPPEALVAEVQRLQKGGRVLSQGIAWRRDHWRTDKLASFQPRLDEIAERSRTGDGDTLVIERRHVFELADGDPVTLFLAAMVWGYGRVGYGPERVGEMVRAAGAELAPRLERQREAARCGPAEAWTSFRSTDRLIRFGPAFASKYAYFAAFESTTDGVKPLIVDINTSWGIWDLVKLPQSVELKTTYVQYVEAAHHWAEQRNWRADEVEWALFEIGKRVRSHR